MAEEIRLSKSFIETELPQAPPLYVSVYLMTLAVGQDVKKVAEKLARDICRRSSGRSRKDLH